MVMIPHYGESWTAQNTNSLPTTQLITYERSGVELRSSAGEPGLAQVIIGLGVTALALYGFCAFVDAIAPRPNRGRIPAADKEYVSIRDRWRCTYCGRRVTRSTRHIDHRRSIANGGTDHLNNLALACSVCNLSKGSLNARDFRRM